MNWTVLLHDDFDVEFAALNDSLQDELLAHAKLLAESGPNLGRPTVDTLKGFRHANMKGCALVGMDRFGGWHLLLTHSDKRFRWSQATKAVPISGVFTGNSSRWQMPAMDSTFKPLK